MNSEPQNKWAVSTQSKITSFVDDYLIGYPQANVRKSTQRLLTSLFKKGNEQQRISMLQLLDNRIQNLFSMGSASDQLLTLLYSIFREYHRQYPKQNLALFHKILSQAEGIYTKITSFKEYNFYSLCLNMIDDFKPFLIEANGCLKCFGKPECDFETLNIANVKEQMKVHLNYVEFGLKRKYEIRNLKVTFGKKKINYKSISVYYRNEEGDKVELGKFGPNDTIPSFSITTEAIGLTFEFQKVRRNHITCYSCSSGQQYAMLCTNCLNKLLEIDGQFKILGGNSQKIGKQLCESYKLLNVQRNQLQNFANCVTEKSKVSLLKSRIISDMTSTYTHIIQNIRLLEENQSSDKKTSINKVADCYSCHFFEYEAILKFFKNILRDPKITEEWLPVDDLIRMLVMFNGQHLPGNKVKRAKETISEIVGLIFMKLGDINFEKELKIGQKNAGDIFEILINLIKMIKTTRKLEKKKGDSFVNLETGLKRYILNSEVNKFFNMSQRIILFVNLVLNKDQIDILDEMDLPLEQTQDLKRMTLIHFKEYQGLIQFKIIKVCQQLDINNEIRIFLRLLPEECKPESNLEIRDAEYLRYTKNVVPEISEKFVMSNIVFTPRPIIKLNLFKILPELIKKLPLEESMQLLVELSKYRPFWNLFIREAVDNFDKMISEVEKERKISLCLEGFDKTGSDLYFEHIYRILTPERPSFIIRLEIPEQEMQKEEKNRGMVEYIYLPIREVKSEDLKGDTIGSLHEWVAAEIRKLGQDMPFDLIVEKNIIDNLDLSLEIVYKKIVQKQQKKQIGNKVYEFFRVIYRIQGIFGEAHERNCGNPRDEKLQDCINYSSYLLNKVKGGKIGLDVLMSVLPTLRIGSQDKKRRQMVFKILELVFKNEPVIKKIVERQYGDYILNLAVKFLSLDKTDVKISDMLLQMCSKVVDEANNQMIHLRKNSWKAQRKYSEAMEQESSIPESEKTVKFVLERAKEAQDNGMKQISRKLIKILPFCSKDDYSTSQFLFEYFQANKFLQSKYSLKVSWLVQFVQSLSESYESFKKICKQNGLSESLIAIVDAILNSLQKYEQTKTLDNIEGAELSLGILKGLIQGDLQLQNYLFDRGILQKIYKIGTVGTSKLSNQSQKHLLNKITLICFQIAKYFQQGKMIASKVQQFFLKNEEEKKKNIQTQKKNRKDEILKKKKKAMETFQHLMIEQKDPQTVICSSCKQGYRKKKQILGVYLHSTKIEILALDSWWKDNKKIPSITSTSYFTPIHYQCHMNAAKDDLKLHKSEWEGALIRNSQVLCNNWCPFKGPQTSDQEYDRVYRKYFDRNGKNGTFWTSINDLNGLLERFSKDYDFSEETKGSSAIHNAKLIPVLLAFTSHILKNSQDIKYLIEGVASVEQQMPRKPLVVNLYFSALLFLCNFQQFEEKKMFCWKLIENLGYQSFKDVKPHLVYFGFVNEIIKLLNQKVETNSNKAQHLDQFIPKNFVEITIEIQKLTEKYKGIFLKWEDLESAKKYFF